MLIELRIENLAVVERLVLKAGDGLNVLTGETGTGKSLIVGALSLLLGERASADAVRVGAQRAIIEGVFDITGTPDVRMLLDEHGIDVDDSLVILRREIVPEGRSRAWVNGAASTASFVGEIGSRLVDLHGQHEHQSLLQSRTQRQILDRFADATGLAAEVSGAHARLREARTQLDAIDAQRTEIERRSNLLRAQVEEIEKAKLESGEKAEFEAEARRLTHAEELARLAGSLHDGLYAGEDAVAARLDSCRRLLAQLARLDPRVEEWQKVLQDAFLGVQEFGRQMGDYVSAVHDDPGRLEAVQRRLERITQLEAKYGPTVDDVIATAQASRTELEQLDDEAGERARIEKAIAEAGVHHQRLCTVLTKARTGAASRLDAAICTTLPGLGMADAVFETRLDPIVPPAASGAEAVEFRVSVNAGFEPGPLARVASGGEMSRIMLALKAALAGADPVPTLVFDEIDAGIGGRAAHRVGERLRRVASHHQVFVVTHLAQIAAQADRHALVDKQESAGLAAATVTELSGDDRVREIARLLGGDPESETSRAHARELLDAARPAPGGNTGGRKRARAR